MLAAGVAPGSAVLQRPQQLEYEHWGPAGLEGTLKILPRRDRRALATGLDLLPHNPLILLGFSPGNAYFTRKRIELAVCAMAHLFGDVTLAIPDSISAHTYRAMGHTEQKSRAKARENGINLRNRALAAMERVRQTTPTANLRFLDWDTHIASHPAFHQTWWFYSLAVIAAAAAIYNVHNRRVARLRDANAIQERFARQLIDTQERERKRIAAELHDSLGQSLLIIRNQAVLGGMGAPAQNGAQFAAIAGTAAQTLEEVRQIAADLRPHHLDRLGLTQALEAMVEKAAGVTEIAFLTEIDDVDGAFAKDAEITVFRVLQESINNILKHSEATQARVRVVRQPGTVQVTITDNGRGFAPRPAAEELGFGLTGMAKRVRILGGLYTVESSPGNGTSIHVQLRSEGAPHGQ